MKGARGTNFRAKKKWWTIQRLSHPGIHPIVRHQTQTLMHNARKILLRGLCYSCFVWGYASAWQIQKWMLTVFYWMEHRAPNGGAKVPKELKGSATIQVEQQYELTSTPRVRVSNCTCSRRWPT
jgi:hypothetical protein